MQTRLVLFFALLAPFCATAQTTNKPTIYAIVNPTSFGPTYLAPGGFATIIGANLSSTTESADFRKSLPTTLAGIQVILDGVAMPMLLASPSQVTFQVDYGLELFGLHLVETWIVASNIYSNYVLWPGNLTAAGIYRSAGNDAVVQDPYDRNLRDCVGNPVPRKNGLIAFTLYGNALGPVAPLQQNGKPAAGPATLQATNTVTVLMNGTTIPTAYVGLSPGSVALYQINIVVPSNALPQGGRYITVVMTSSDTYDVVSVCIAQ